MCCPRCGNALDYDDDEDEWMCLECDFPVSPPDALLCDEDIARDGMPFGFVA